MKEQLDFFQEKLTYEIDPSDLFDTLNSGNRIIVIDARKTDAFHREHLPGAINLPYSEINEKTTNSFDKDAIYAVYCDGIGCNASTKASYILSKLGFRVKEVIGGITRWKFDGFGTEGLENFKGQNVKCAC